jgi:UMF1 family MFS transporter
MLGKFSAVLGPVMMGSISLMTGDPRIAILLPIVLFIAGGVILLLVNEREGMRRARAMERA